MVDPESSSNNGGPGIEFDTSGVEFAGDKKSLETIRAEQRELLAADLLQNGEKSRAHILFMKDGVEVPDPEEPTFNDVLDQEPNWQEDRLRLQQESIWQQYENSAALSKSLRSAEKKRGISPTIYVLRGLSGSGKTYACKKRFPGMLFDSEGEPMGTLAPDNSKKDLYKAGGTSDQIHKESSSMYRRLKRKIAHEAITSEDGFSEIHDRVMDAPEDIQEVIDNAKETHRNINMLDIDVPYVVSAVRVLQRPKDAPCPNFTYLEKTFKRTRGNRQKIIEMLENADSEQTPVNYSLLCYDYSSDPKQIQREAARFTRDPETGKQKLEVLNEELYRQATEKIDEEIESVKNQVIDEHFIDWYCETFFDKDPGSQELAKQTRQDLLAYMTRQPKITIYEALAEKNK